MSETTAPCPCLSVVIPAYNGEATIADVVRKVLKLEHLLEVVVVQDADLEYDPVEIPEVIGPILQGRADVVYGSRFLVRRAARVPYFYRYLADKGLTFFSNLLTNINLTDVEAGRKAFRGASL